MSTIEKIRVGTLLKGAVLLDEDCKNPIWKAPIKCSDDSTEIVYLKVFDERTIFVEALCALMGRLIGLSIPEPILVYVYPEQEKELFKEEPVSNGFIAYGSLDADYPSLNRLVNCNENVEIWEKLKRHSKALEAAIFDEWIVNVDRHWGNLLFDGSDGFIYIDHDLALASGMESDKPLEQNLLLEFICEDLDELSKQRIIREVNSDIKPRYDSINIYECVRMCYGEQILQDDILSEIVSFLTARLDILDQLVKEQVAPVQKELFHAV